MEHNHPLHKGNLPKKIIRYIIPLIVIGVGVGILLVKMTTFEHTLEVIQTMPLWLLGLAALAQLTSYLGSGFVLRSLMRHCRLDCQLPFSIRCLWQSPGRPSRSKERDLVLYLMAEYHPGSLQRRPHDSCDDRLESRLEREFPAGLFWDTVDWYPGGLCRQYSHFIFCQPAGRGIDQELKIKLFSSY